MTNLLKTRKGIFRASLLVLILAVIGSGTIFSRARTMTVSLTVTNSTNREVRHVYLSAPDSNNWGPDQLSDNHVIPPGGSATFNVTCEQASTKVIAEDQNGCFVSGVVSCSGSPAWTITNEMTPDCGG